MLQLVLSRAGYGKTEYVFSTINKLVENGKKDILLITPEQFSFIAERRLLTELGESKINCVESTSFTRLAGEISKRCSGDVLPTLSKGAKAVKMKEAIEAVQDGLSLFNKNRITPSFIHSAISIYDEMKSCRVSADDIALASENTDKEILKRKLKDISLIISSYDALITNEYYDPANTLTRLYEKLIGMNYFKDRTVFIDGFSGFVAQEYKVLEVILKQAETVYITFCTDSYLNKDRFDLFYYVNSNIQILREVSKKCGVRFLTPVVLDKENRFRSRELALAEKYAFSHMRESFDGEPADISLYAANNIYDECDRTAFEISRLLREGYRANEIAVICRDLTKYETELRFSFQKYNIPFFDDERQSISAQPLMMFVNFLMRTLIYSFRSEDIFSLLKTGLTALEPDAVNALENYAFIWNVNGSTWKKPFTKSTKGFTENIDDEDADRLKEINRSREYIMQILLRLKKRTKDASVKDICTAVYKAMNDFGARERLKALAMALDKSGKSALAAEQGRIWDMLMDILDKLALVSGNVPISLKEFYGLFRLMVTSEDLGTLPVGLDNVQLGAADRIRCDKPRAVFILGANEGEFPKSVASAGLFSESDRIELIRNNFKLYSYGETLTAQEKYFAYMAVCAASEKLYVSYICSGENATPSMIVNGLKAVFPNLKTSRKNSGLSLNRLESKGNAFELMAASISQPDTFVSTLEKYFESQTDYSARLKAVKALVDNDAIVLTDADVASGLFRRNMYLSASRIEEYYNCSFRYFCKFGLNARPRLRAEMDPMQTGTVIHYVLEQLLRKTGSDGLAALEDGEVALLVSGYLSEYLHHKMGDAEQFTPRFKYQFMRLSKMLTNVVLRLRDEFSHSDFKAAAFELQIGNGENGETVKSKRLILPDGGSIEIKGAVDRVDVYEAGSKKYIRVVDYKSGRKDFSLNDILYGLNLQMFIYLFTLAQSKSSYHGVTGGVLYMHSSRSLLSLERNTTQDKIKSEENKSFKMKGIVLNDEENALAKHMEHELAGRYIPVRYVKKTDSLTGDIVTLEEFGRLSRKIDELIVNMGTSLHKGIISQNPINGKGHDKTCEICDYGAVCMNRKIISAREMKERTNSEVLTRLKEEQDA